MLIVVNYANKRFKNARRLQTKSAYKIGGADKVIEYSENDIDEKFYAKNKKILSQKRGNGYWLWKPYIIKKSLSKIKDGDYLMYCDSGAYFTNKIQYLIDVLEKEQTDLLCFQINALEKNWTKRDAFILMECDNSKYWNSNQIEATFVLIKKSKRTQKFVDEWLKYASDERINTDLPNQLGKENFEGFKENRHDQTVFSLLCKKYGYEPHRDISQYGNKDILKNSPYPQIAELHRIGFANTKVGIKIYRIILPFIMPLINKIRNKLAN